MDAVHPMAFRQTSAHTFRQKSLSSVIIHKAPLNSPNKYENLSLRKRKHTDRSCCCLESSPQKMTCGDAVTTMPVPYPAVCMPKVARIPLKNCPGQRDGGGKSREQAPALQNQSLLSCRSFTELPPSPMPRIFRDQQIHTEKQIHQKSFSARPALGVTCQA